MNHDRRNNFPLQMNRFFVALLLLLSISLSLTSVSIANNCEDECCAESSESNESNESNEGSQECDDCLSCLQLVKVYTLTEFNPSSLYHPESAIHCLTSLNNLVAPLVEIDHPPQNLN